MHAITMMAMVAMNFLPAAFLVAASPILHEESDGSSGATTSKVETEPIIAATAAGATSAAANNGSKSCTDDPNFMHRNKRVCNRVKNKKRKKRKKFCNKTKRDQPFAERCRESCDFQNCKTFQKYNDLEDNKNKLTVGVYYYPWWGEDFHRGNVDNPDNYLRSQLIEPQQLPALGEYDDREPTVIAKHLSWSRQNNIGLWVTSWWGEDRREDLTIKNKILVHPQLRGQRIAIFYETTSRIREKYNYTLINVVPDLEYLCKEYFHHPNYYTIGVDAYGNADVSSEMMRPVLFVYLTRKLEVLGLLPGVITLMRQGARNGGCGEIFIVGDQVFQGPPSVEKDKIPFELLDAVTNYDVYGSMQGGKNGGYVGGREKVTEYYQEQNQWKALAHSQDCAFIPCVSPGFNDRGVRPEVNRTPLSRRLNKDAPEGSLFQAALEEARKIVDPAMGHLLMVNSMNEWHEDTQIEPCVDVDESKAVTNQPYNLTNGLEYEGYGNLYLEILKEETESWDPSMLILAPAAKVTTEEAWIPVNGIQEELVTISDIMGWELE